jgi:hypothetical protein
MLRDLAPYLEIVAQGDLAKLESTGYDLQHDRTHSTGPGPLPAPQFLRVERTGGSGLLLARVQPVDGAASYEVQLATADPAVEANWKPALISTTPSRIELKGLTPGTTYYVRVRGIGSHGPGDWANSPGVIAV